MNKTLKEIEEEVKNYENENNRLKQENTKLKQEIWAYEKECEKLYFEALELERELLKKQNKYMFFLKNNYDKIYIWLMIIVLVFIIIYKSI